MDKTSLGDRMKKYYEERGRRYLSRRIPVIMRLDGRVFHTLTKGFQKPFDNKMSEWMINTAITCVSEIQGAKCAYVQSDEISILITDYDRLTTDAWFNYEVQKMTSTSAAIASVEFTLQMIRNSFYNGTKFTQAMQKKGTFDSRVFNIPREDVNNYFVWRQQDWVRNSVQMLASAHFSHKELHKKNQKNMHEMLHTKGINWAHFPDKWKNGVFIWKEEKNGVMIWKPKNLCPIFSKQPEIINSFLKEINEETKSQNET